jgi:hypothetical protein
MASDVFSLALIGYELLAGVRPTWPFDWPPANFDRFSDKVPVVLHPVFRKAMQLQPSKRYPDAIAFLAELDRGLARAAALQKSPQRRPMKVRNPLPSPLSLQFETFRRRHGAQLGMRYKCHRCDGPIAESMQYCPWCGSADNSFAEITGYPLICPECERGVRPEWTSCPWCYKGRFDNNGRSPRLDVVAVRSCSRRGCSGQLRPFMRYCPICKEKTRRPWADPDLPSRCTRCRWSVSNEYWRYCPWCGRRVPQAEAYKTRGRSR